MCKRRVTAACATAADLGRFGRWRVPALLLLGVLLLAGCATPKPAAAEAQELAVGERVYVEHCAACHGLEGEGQPNWRSLGPDGRLPAPPHNNEGHTWHHPDQQLLGIIARGGLLPNSNMPGFADVLTEEEMVAVLAYIKTFWGPQELEFQRRITEREAQ